MASLPVFEKRLLQFLSAIDSDFIFLTLIFLFMTVILLSIHKNSWGLGTSSDLDRAMSYVA